MKITTIDEVSKMSDKTPIPAFAGTVRRIRDRFSGNGENGPWSLQDLEVDAQGGMIPVKLADRDPAPKEWVGKKLVFRLNDAGKGVYARHDAKKQRNIVKVTPTGVIEPYDENSGLLPEQPRQSAIDPVKRSVDVSQSEALSGLSQQDLNPTQDQIDERRLASIRQDLNRRANLYLLAMTAAEYVRMQWRHIGHEMSDQHFQSCVASLFIGSEKVGSVGGMPTGKFTDLNP